MSKLLLRLVAVFIVIVLVLALGMGAGIALDRGLLVVHAAPQSSAATSDKGPDMQLITQAWNDIQRAYVDPSAEGTKPLTYGAISGMVSALGDTGHTTFLSPEMLKSEHNYTQGQFEGIGAEVQSQNGNTVIVAPLDNSPAQKAGLQAGDIIMKVNGNDVTGLPLEQVVNQILGPAGTSVSLTIFDPKSNKKFDVTLTRARIQMQNVTWQKLPGTTIAHLRIAGFSQGVSQELKQALTEMKQQGVTGIILDLRNNPGGLLDESVNTASQFLSGGDVLLEKNAQGQTIHVAAHNGGLATDIPMTVLINNGSASASEIVAGAIQDAGRGQLIGETTFGTGTVLDEFPLSDGSALMLATEEWLTPKGRVIWHKGITPDDTVALPATGQSLTPEAERSMTAQQLQASGDTQLLQAVQTLAKTSSIAPGTWLSSNQPAAPSLLTAPLALELSELTQWAWL